MGRVEIGHRSQIGAFDEGFGRADVPPFQLSGVIECDRVPRGQHVEIDAFWEVLHRRGVTVTPGDLERDQSRLMETLRRAAE